MVPGQMLRGHSTSPFVCYFFPCVRFKQGSQHLQREGPTGGRGLWFTTEDHMLKTLPKPWHKGIFPLSSSVCHSREAGQDPRMQLRCIFNFFLSPTREEAAAQNPPQGRRPLGWKRKLAADALAGPEKGQAGISQTRITWMPSLPTFTHKGCVGLCSLGLGCTTAAAPRVLLSPPAPSTVRASLNH